MERGGSLLEKFHRSAPTRPVTRRDLALGLGLSLFFFIVYLYTCSRGPNISGDSPELISAAYSLGVPHPPGYPLYTMLGHLVTMVPVGGVAFRINAFSSLLHALTLFLFFLGAVKMTGNRAASSIAAAALGFSSLFWFYSLVAEVFALNDLFAVLLILVALAAREKWAAGEEGKARRLLYILGFLCALSLCNHYTIVLFFPALLLFVLRPLLSMLRRPRHLLAALAFFLAGLLPYIYLPLSAARQPYVNFGDPSSLGNFVEVVTRSYYGTTKLWSGPAAAHRLDLVFDYLKTLDGQVYIFGIALGTAGMFHAARKRLGDFLPLFTAFLLTAVVFPLMANVKIRGIFDVATIERFYLLPTIAFLYFVAFGMNALLSAAEKGLSRLPAREDIRRGVLWVISLLVALPFLLPSSSTSVKVNLKYDPLGETYIKDLVHCVEEGSLLFVPGDVPIQLLEYYKTVLGDHKDLVILIETFITNGWYIKTIRKWYPDLHLPSNREVEEALQYDTLQFRSWLMNYLIDHNPQIPAFYSLTKPRELRENRQFVPWGMCFRILPKDQEIDLDEYRATVVNIWKGLRYDGMDPFFYTENRREMDFSIFLSQYARETGAFMVQHGALEEAVPFFLAAYSMAPAHEYLGDLANIYLRLGRVGDAYRVLEIFVDTGSIYDKEVWKALMKMEDIQAEGESGDGR